MTKLTKRSFLAGGLALLAAPAFAAKEPYWYLERDNFVAQGADVVAYFGLPQNARRAVDGDNAFTTRWNDANWRFSSAEHLDMFKANPNRFAPIAPSPWPTTIWRGATRTRGPCTTANST